MRRFEYHHNSRDARLAPSTIAFNLAQTTLVSTFRPHAEVPKPQSLPASTFSRPTSRAYWQILYSQRLLHSGRPGQAAGMGRQDSPLTTFHR